MNEVRIATRRSQLALAQSRRVGELIGRSFPGTVVRLVGIETVGDGDLGGPITELTGLGAFTKEVSMLVLAGEADLAVHSLKDLPVAGTAGLEVVAYPERLAPWDVLVGMGIDDLAQGAVIGTGSPRRAAQLVELRHDLKATELRGNVDTRLRRVAAGEVDGAVLAQAGLERLGREDVIAYRFSVEEMVPAPGQAALAVEARPGTRWAEMAAAIDDASLRPLLSAERMLLAETGAGCRAALGALATSEAGRIVFDCFVADNGGPRRCHVEAGSPEEAVAEAIAELEL